MYYIDLSMLVMECYKPHVCKAVCKGFTFLLCAEGAALLIDVSAAVSEAHEGFRDSGRVPTESFHLLR